jgi:anti-sigma factor RsiW
MTEPHRRHWLWMRAIAGAAASILAGAALGVVAGWTLAMWYSRASPALESDQLARRAALAHAVYAPEVRHPVEVAAGERAHLTAWLSKRLEVDVRAPDLGAAGFALLGGRLLPGEALSGAASLPAAQFMYENANGRRVTLYVRNAGPRQSESELNYSRVGAVVVLHWIEGGLGYAVASADVGRGELRGVAQTVRRQRDPGFVRR